MSPVAANPLLSAETLQGQVTDAAWASALPASILDRWSLASAHQVRTAVVAHADESVVGVLFAVHRPMTAYEKVVGAWTAETVDSDDVLDALLSAIAATAEHAGAVALKVELDPRSTDDVGALEAAAIRAGLSPIAPPVVGSAFPHDPDAVPRGRLRWLGFAPPTRTLPYYRQTTEFTCGPVALGMAAADRGLPAWLGRDVELGLWREANTIMGCDPFGLAVAAHRRGVRVSVLINTDGPILLEGATQEWDRDTRSHIQRSFRAEALEAGLDVRTADFELAQALEPIENGGAVVILIDEHPMHDEHCPHWVTAHGRAGDVVILNDPWTDDHLGESWVDGVDLPIRVGELAKLAQWGPDSHRAAIQVAAADAAHS